MKTLTQFLFTLLALACASITLAATSSVGATPGSFAVSPSGAATYSIPIQVPPGMGGMQPNISLVYNSQAGNGIAGVGWNIGGLSAITRCGATIDRDGSKGGVDLKLSDKYCLDGQRLIAISAIEYRTEIESFSKVVATGTQGNGPAYFTVTSKNGVTTEYGNGNGSQQFVQGNSTTVLSWHVSKIKDVVGNYVQFVYNTDSATTGEHRIDHIDYTYLGTVFVGGVSRSVKFNYGARSDVETSYVGGGAVRTSQRLTSVQALLGGVPVRSYGFGYDNSAATRRSRLISTQESGTDGALLPATNFTWQAGSAGDFIHWSNYSGARGAVNGYEHQFADVNGDGRADWIQLNRGANEGCVGLAGSDGNIQHWNYCTGAAGAVNGYEHHFADVNGDGRADWIQLNRGGNEGCVGLANADGTFTFWNYCTGAVGDVKGYEHQFADVNGDGRADWIQLSRGGNQGCVGLANADGTFKFWNYCTGAAGAVTGYEHHFIDINGDGRADWIQLNRGGDEGCVGLANGDGTFVFWKYCTGAAGAVNGYAHYFVDVNGDGKIDWIQVNRNSNDGWAGLSHGDGNFEFWTNYSGARGAVAGYEHQFADVNGDGRADWIQIDRNGDNGWVGLATADGNFEHWTNHTGAAGAVNGYAHYFADINGDGRTDWIQVNRSSNNGWIGLVSGNTPDLLSTITNGLGVVTSTYYKPLTDTSVYIKDPDTSVAYPNKNVQMPLYVVSSASSSNGLGGFNTASYSYTGMKEHQTGRGNLGFRTMTVTGADGSVNTTTFAQTWPFIGMPVETSTKVYNSSTGTWVTVGYQQNHLSSAEWTAAIWNSVSSAPSYTSSAAPPATPTLTAPTSALFASGACTFTDNTRTCLPFVDWSYSLSKDFGTNTPFSASLADSSNPDRYGNVTTGTATSYDGYKTVTTNYFSNDTANWRLGWVVASQVSSTVPAAYSTTGATVTSPTPRTTLNNYDTLGRLIRTVVEPEAGTFTLSIGTYTAPTVGPFTALVTEYGYDPTYGFQNAVTVKGGDITTRTTSTAYVNSTNPGSVNPQVRTTNALSHTETTTYDARFGVPLSTTGPNGLVTTWTYDGFGRKVKELRADGTATTTSLTDHGSAGLYLSADIGSARYSSTTQVLNTSGTDMVPPVKVYYDMLGRELRSETQGFNSATIYKDTAYDSLGRVKKVSRPYFSSNTVYWTTPAYDALGRTYNVTTPDGAISSTTFNSFTTTMTAPASNDGKLRKRTEVKNSQGQIVSVTDALNGVITYKYDAFGNLGKVTTTGADAKTATITTTYDIRGRKTAMTDPDMGAWSYTYDVLGELLTQKDAKLQTATMTYDVLGRMTKRVEVEGTSTWTYDTAANGKGKLASVTGPTNSYARSYVYDSLGRAAIVGTSINSVLYNMSVGYDTGTGRVTNVQFPSTVAGFGNFAFYNNYDTRGFLTAVSSLANNGGTKYWQLDVNGIDAQGRVISETLGNSTQTKRSYNPISDLLSDIDTTGPAGVVQDSNYTYYSGVPNLNTRSSYVAGSNYTETFTYDALNRVLSANITGGASKAFAYDSLGNITSKTGVGSYTYGTATVRPHAVASITGTVNGVVNPSYTYDANGNQTIGAGRTLGYTSFNLPKSVTMAAISQSYAYDAEHQRIVMTEGAANTTTYINPRWDAGTHFEKEKKGNIDEYKHYIYAGGRPVAMYVVKRDNGTGINSTYTRYLHTDHLGSVDVITSETGAIVERLSYDAWGKRRNANGTDSATQLTSNVTHHGYTGHEMIDSIGLINMNGRWYDPTLGRMMQADPTIQSPGDLQNYNRYSYVLNNPLSMTDPSGYNWLSKRWKAAWHSKPMHVFRMYQVASAVIAANVAICVGSSGTACASSLYATAKGIEAYDMGVRDPGQMALIYGGNYLYAYGKISMVTGGYDAFASNGLKGLAQYGVDEAVRREQQRIATNAVGRYANHLGISRDQLNLGLFAISMAGNAIYGSRSSNRGNVSFLNGLGSRDGFGLSVAFDVADLALGYQGLPSASAAGYALFGDKSKPLVGYSLGGMDASNIAGEGWGNLWGFGSSPIGTYVVAPAPFVSAPFSAMETIGSSDLVNLGFVGALLHPGANVASSSLNQFSNLYLGQHTTYSYPIMGELGLQ